MNKPRFKDYHTDEGLHHAMLQYADSFNKSSLLVKVEYSDGSVDDKFHIFTRSKKPIQYRTADGEIYEVCIDTGKYEPNFLPDHNAPLTGAELKNAVKDWLNNHGGYKTVKFIDVIN